MIDFARIHIFSIAIILTLGFAQMPVKAANSDFVKLIAPIMLLLDDADNNLDLCSSAITDLYVPDLGDNPPHTHTDPGKMAEHMAIFDFVSYDFATHVAVGNGQWNDASIWYGNRVPGDCANVVIPVGINVVYDGDNSARLNTVRVDGQLEFSTTRSSKMRLDTLVVDPRGTLQIGTKSNPVLPGVTAEIIIADNGDIDVRKDPMLLSRGIVAHGTTRIHGAYKKTHLKAAVDPSAGQSTLRLAELPVGWRVGDKLVIAGTRYLGWKWDNTIRQIRFFGTQDEVRNIEAISGNTVTLNQALDYDHTSPRGDLKVSIANYTRNVTVRTENADALPAHRRGHVMFMHSNKVNVRYAEFDELGRTDKSVDSFEVRDISSIRSNSNVRGRYSFHFHRTGIDNEREPAIAVGNAVFGSPGWGFTHHDSHALFHENASYNTFGAGFVAETGNETGIWSSNIAIGAKGNSSINPKNGNNVTTFDMGMSGDGFWFQGRLVRSIDNVAASVNHGYVYLHRGSGMINFDADRFMLPEALGLGLQTAPDDPPIRHFDNNEAFASTVGLYIVKANPAQEHDIMTVLSNFTAWEVRFGAGIEYTAHYLVDNFDLIGATPGDFFEPSIGLTFNTNTSDMVIKNPRIRDFPNGIRLGKEQHNESHIGKDQFVLISPEYINVQTPLVDYDAAIDSIMQSSDLVPDRFSIDVDKNAGKDYFEYFDSPLPYNNGELYTGTKTDSIGDGPIPGGIDTYGILKADLIANLETHGYFQDIDSGDTFTIIENYFSDRATGEIYKYGFKTYIMPSIVDLLGNQYFEYRNAVNRGPIDLNNQSPTAQDDFAATTTETDVQINLTNNDSDPEDDSLVVDGIVTPRNGLIFQDSNSTITYRPNIGFNGVDEFYYWVGDNYGNFNKAKVSVTVSQ